jgi:hypothetical protein
MHHPQDQIKLAADARQESPQSKVGRLHITISNHPYRYGTVQSESGEFPAEIRRHPQQ